MTNDLYNYVLDMADNGAAIYIDLNNKNMTINNKVYIENGKNVSNMDLFDNQDKTNAEKLEDLIETYEDYKTSVPNKLSSKRQKVLFYALKEDKLSDIDLIVNPPRHIVKIALEYKILAYVISGLKFPGKDKHWFWACPEDKDFILFKKWF